MSERLLRKIAEAIWTADGDKLLLLDEIATPNSLLNKQQRSCWQQAKAVLATLER